MKKIILLGVVAFLSATISAQVVPNKDYVTFPPTSGTREMIDNVPSALDLTNSAVYISGYTRSLLSGRDYLLIKYDLNGNILWQKTFDYSGLNDRALAITVDNSGNVIITGEATSLSNGTDIITRKYDTNGNLLWSATHNGSANADDKGLGVVTDNSGDIYLSGYSSNTGTGKDFTVIRYNSSGVQQYVYTKNGTSNGDDIANAIAFFGNKLYVAGNITNTGTGADLYITRLNANNASVNWSKTENGTASTNDQGLDVKVMGNDVLVCGGVNNTGTGQDYFFGKYNASNGITVFTNTYDGLGANDFATSLVIDASNTYAITGLSQNGSNYEYHTTKYNNPGVLSWVNKHKTNAAFLNVFPKIAVDALVNHFYVSGVTFNSSIDAALYQITPGGNQSWVDYHDGFGLRDGHVDLSVDNFGRIYLASLNERTPNIFDIALIRYSQTPVYFPPDFNSEPASRMFGYMANKGQLLRTDYVLANEVKYYTEFGKSLYYIKDDGHSIVHTKRDSLPMKDSLSRIDVSFFESNPLSKPYNFEAYPDLSNFYQSHCPAGVEGVQCYKRLMVPNLYPGIDLHYFSNNEGVKYYFVVKPGTDPNVIMHKFTGASSTSIDGSGKLHLNTLIGNTAYDKSIAYQVNAALNIVPLSWTADWVNIGPDLYKFNIGSYSPALPLVIQVDKPSATLAASNPRWSTYYGNSGHDQMNGLDSDNNDFVYVTGSTPNTTFPATSSQYGISGPGSNETFLFKFSSYGEPQWRTMYGGNGPDFGYAVEVDNTSNYVYFGGTAGDPNWAAAPGSDFPLINPGGAYFHAAASVVGENDYAFVGKFNRTTGVRNWVTLFGEDTPPSYSAVFAIDTDPSGNLFIAGTGQKNSNFPLVTPSTGCPVYSQNITGIQTGFVTKFSSANALIWSTMFGNDNSQITDLETNSLGEIFITGFTSSVNVSSFPLIKEYTNDCMNSYAGGTNDAFISKFNPCLQLKWSTLFGGTSDDRSYGLALLENSAVIQKSATILTSAYICGQTQSTDFPFLSNTNTSSINDNSLTGASDGFLVGFDGQNANYWSSYVGGSSNDLLNKMEFSTSRYLFITGQSQSTNFLNIPYSMAYNQPLLEGVASGTNYDGVVIAMDGNTTFSSLWSTFYGGDASLPIVFSDDEPQSISVSNLNVFICGKTWANVGFPLSADLIGHPTAYYQTNMGNFQDLYRDAFIATMDMSITPILVKEIKALTTDFSIYPNPSSGDVFVLFKEGSKSDKIQIEIHDLQGKTLMTKYVSNFENTPILLNLSNLSSGMYLVKGTDQNIMITQKIVISK